LNAGTGDELITRSYTAVAAELGIISGNNKAIVAADCHCSAQITPP
jgi:hypothetical protein